MTVSTFHVTRQALKVPKVNASQEEADFMLHGTQGEKSDQTDQQLRSSAAALNPSASKQCCKPSWLPLSVHHAGTLGKKSPSKM